jgi:hypothetical protein
MAVTRLKRKVRKNRTKATQRKATMKRLLATPVIKNVDIEQLKEELTPAKELSTAASV